ncbi:hypothetical protein niasHT_012771 [Heterodera trifolii]|uniref:Uncharacterized protein n=1 Tax=Heterodera trifolii TaxID=157864 RepID=A0ABD2LK62_9BILA
MASFVEPSSMMLLPNPNISPKLSLRPLTPTNISPTAAVTPRRHTVFACSESKRGGAGGIVIGFLVDK